MVKTLIVDGDNLFKIGFHGVRDFYHEGKHIGGIFHFVNVLRRFLSEYNYDKVIVFWDGNNNSSQRKLLFSEYKENSSQPQIAQSQLEILNEFKTSLVY
mgnify:CR=1 FL=1